MDGLAAEDLAAHGLAEDWQVASRSMRTYVWTTVVVPWPDTGYKAVRNIVLDTVLYRAQCTRTVHGTTTHLWVGSWAG